MGTNTTLLLIVVAVAILVLTSVLAGVVYKTRGQKVKEAVRDQVEDYAKAQAARVDIEINTAPATGTRADKSPLAGQS
ncbi:hypothetical protein ACGFK1_28925 [Mycobacterium sp. NPDC048908]|uniref:hypothetical protein n=1 Tax=Mycobacterium sp. NPDC048908 TaxID=3364292 RepID=UPI003721CEEC